MRRDLLGAAGAAGAGGQCAPAALARRDRAAPQLHRWSAHVPKRFLAFERSS